MGLAGAPTSGCVPSIPAQASAAAPLPHVSECGYCHSCQLAPASEPSPAHGAQQAAADAHAVAHVRASANPNVTDAAWVAEGAASFAASAAASGLPGALAGPAAVRAELLGPPLPAGGGAGVSSKPNCSSCWGCDASLADLRHAAVTPEGFNL